MASYVKTSTGKIRAFVYSQKRGKTSRLSRTFGTKKEAETWAFRLEIMRNGAQDISVSRTLFSDFFESWLENVKRPNVRETSYKEYVSYGRTVTRLFAGLRLQDLNQTVVQRILDNYARKYAQKTVQALLVVIRSCVRYAVAIGALPLDWSSLVKAHGQRPTKQNVALSIGEMRKLRQYCFAHTADEFCVLILLALESGLRRGELLGLRPDDLAVENKTYFVRVRRSKTSESKSLKLKTVNAKRDVAISERVFNLVKTLKPNADGYVFQPHGFLLSHKLAPILLKLGLPHTTIHGLRDTSASFLFSQGIDIATVSNRLGHANIAITQQYYITLMPEKKQVEDERIKNLFNGL